MFARVTTYELAEGRASESISVFEPAVDSVRSWTDSSTAGSSSSAMGSTP